MLKANGLVPSDGLSLAWHTVVGTTHGFNTRTAANRTADAAAALDRRLLGALPPAASPCSETAVEDTPTALDGTR